MIRLVREAESIPKARHAVVLVQTEHGHGARRWIGPTGTQPASALIRSRIEVNFFDTFLITRWILLNEIDHTHGKAGPGRSCERMKGSRVRCQRV